MSGFRYTIKQKINEEMNFKDRVNKILKGTDTQFHLVSRDDNANMNYGQPLCEQYDFRAYIQPSWNRTVGARICELDINMKNDGTFQVNLIPASGNCESIKTLLEELSKIE